MSFTVTFLKFFIEFIAVYMHNCMFFCRIMVSRSLSHSHTSSASGIRIKWLGKIGVVCPSVSLTNEKEENIPLWTL